MTYCEQLKIDARKERDRSNAVFRESMRNRTINRNEEAWPILSAIFPRLIRKPKAGDYDRYEICGHEFTAMVNYGCPNAPRYGLDPVRTSAYGYSHYLNGGRGITTEQQLGEYLLSREESQPSTKRGFFATLFDL